jgi:hypothetical protein
MLGLFAMLLICAALVAVASYWIFWEMEHAERRPRFMTKIGNDVVGLFARSQSATHVSPKQPVAT